jgi:hypothetical protein
MIRHIQILAFFIIMNITCINIKQPVEPLKQQPDLIGAWKIDGYGGRGTLFWRYNTDYLKFTRDEVTVYSIFDSCIISSTAHYALRNDTIFIDSTNPTARISGYLVCGWGKSDVGYPTYIDDKFVFYSSYYKDQFFCKPVNWEMPYSSWPVQQCNTASFNFWYDIEHNPRKLK